MGSMGSYLSSLQRDTADSQLMDNDWRKINWGRKNNMKDTLRKIQSHKNIRILVIGPVQAGKSSFIHSIKSIFQDKITNSAYLVSAGDKSFTKNYRIHKFKDDTGKALPFVIGDVMGLENEEDSGVHPDDIINILQGHIKEEYECIPFKPCSENDPGYNRDPALQDKIHCLVFTIPIENFVVHKYGTDVLLSQSLIKKMQIIRQKASELKIPHVAVLTKVDKAYPDMSENIKQLYRSKNICQRVDLCSKTLGIPKNCIFPLKNYSNEMQLDADVDAVLLFTLDHILEAARGFVEEMMEEATVQPDNMDAQDPGPLCSSMSKTTISKD